MVPAATVLVLFAAIAWVGCGQADVPEPSDGAPVSAESLDDDEVEALVLEVAESFLRSADDQIVSDIVSDAPANEVISAHLDKVPADLRGNISALLSASLEAQIREAPALEVAVADVLSNPTVNVWGKMVLEDEIDLPAVGQANYVVLVLFALGIDVASQTIPSAAPWLGTVTMEITGEVE